MWWDVTAGSNSGIKVNLGQSSCYFELTSNFNLAFRGQKVHVSMHLRERNTMVLKWIIIFLSSKVIREKRYISKLLSFLLWPDLEGSRYGLKRSTRVPLDSYHPKDSFSFCPTALSQLGVKWHGELPPPHMCVLGWGNVMCGRGLIDEREVGCCMRIRGSEFMCVIDPVGGRHPQHRESKCDVSVNLGAVKQRAD